MLSLIALTPFKGSLVVRKERHYRRRRVCRRHGVSLTKNRNLKSRRRQRKKKGETKHRELLSDNYYLELFFSRTNQWQSFYQPWWLIAVSLRACCLFQNRHRSDNRVNNRKVQVLIDRKWVCLRALVNVQCVVVNPHLLIGPLLGFLMFSEKIGVPQGGVLGSLYFYDKDAPAKNPRSPTMWREKGPRSFRTFEPTNHAPHILNSTHQLPKQDLHTFLQLLPVAVHDVHSRMAPNIGIRNKDD